MFLINSSKEVNVYPATFTAERLIQVGESGVCKKWLSSFYGGKKTAMTCGFIHPRSVVGCSRSFGDSPRLRDTFGGSRSSLGRLGCARNAEAAECPGPCLKTLGIIWTFV